MITYVYTIYFFVNVDLSVTVLLYCRMQRSAEEQGEQNGSCYCQGARQ